MATEIRKSGVWITLEKTQGFGGPGLISPGAQVHYRFDPEVVGGDARTRAFCRLKREQPGENLENWAVVDG